MITRNIVAFLASLLTPAYTVAQVPPPPSLPGQDDLADQLAKAIEAKDLNKYASLLSDDVQVFEDGKKIADSKAQWLLSYGKQLSAKGVVFKVGPGFSSTGRLLFIEYRNSTASWGGATPAHCCWSHDAVAYDIAKGKAVVIRRLRGGDKSIKLSEQFPDAIANGNPR